MKIGNFYVNTKYYILISLLISIECGISSTIIKDNVIIFFLMFDLIAFTTMGYFFGRIDELTMN